MTGMPALISWFHVIVVIVMVMVMVMMTIITDVNRVDVNNIIFVLVMEMIGCIEVITSRLKRDYVPTLMK